MINDFQLIKVLKSKFVLLLLASGFLNMSFVTAQTFTISGVVTDVKSGETVLYAPVLVGEMPGKGIITNEYGFYSLTLPAGKYTIICNSLGYVRSDSLINLDKNLKYNIKLSSVAVELKEATITENKEEEQLRSAQAGVERIEMKDIAKVPVLFGEKDILKTIQLLPGVKSAGEGNSGFFVRGGAVDQNLILLDEAPVYNASHLLGFFSTFNSDAIKDATLYKGGMPAQYGGRLSSVLDIKMNDGNNQERDISGGIGLISSRLNIEAPIKKDKSSFLLSARRTYVDVFLKLSNDDDIKDSRLYFYDVNAKINYSLGTKDRLFLSGYFGRDYLGLSNVFGIDWGNVTGTARWNHLFSDKVFSNTSLIYSNYNYKIFISSDRNEFDITSKIRDYNFKQEFQFFPNVKHQIRVGFNIIHHTIVPGQITSSVTSGINNIKLQDRYALDNALYYSGDYQLADKWNVIYGLRLTSYSILGKGDYYSFDKDGNVTDTTSYASGEIVETYFNPEPRLSVSYNMNATTSFKAGYARNVQNLHLLSNSTSTSPTDLWISSSKNVKPETSDQISFGYFRNFKENAYELSAETYYKTMNNQIDYRNGADVQVNQQVEGDLLYGDGRAYGLEMQLKKKKGRLSGWISYTLAKTERKIDGINNNEWYNARQDRTHDFSITGIYDLTKRWVLSASWVYYTGNAVTFPTGKYVVDDQVQFLYTERNSYRMPAYHRLDISATVYRVKTSQKESSWNFSLYNAYGRQNAYSIDFREVENDPTRTEAVQTALFRWVPSVTYNFKF
jgi:TonB dependent receptor/CarboxypepD_reg-like domain/TonB-dependent Receptor Plug Domain